MAKTQVPFLSLNAHGSIGKAITVQKRAGQHFVRTIPKPYNPKSPAQTANRTIYGKHVELWRGLAPAAKEVYNRLAVGKHMSGYNYFMMLRPGQYMDFTTFARVPDPLAYTTVTKHKATVSFLPRNVDELLYKDMVLTPFDGDFEHWIDVYFNAGVNQGWVSLWTLANLVDDWHGIEAVSGDEIGLIFYRTGSGVYWLTLQEINAGAGIADIYLCSPSTLYYMKLVRDESVGAFGHLYCYIYNNPTRTDPPLATLELTLTEKQNFRYLYAVQSYNDGYWQTASGFCENLWLKS